MCCLLKCLTDAVVDTTLTFFPEKGRMEQMRRSRKQLSVWRVLCVGVVPICCGTGPALGSWTIRAAHAATSGPWGKWVLAACRCYCLLWGMHTLVYFCNYYGICLSPAKDFAHKVYFSSINRWKSEFCLENFSVKFINGKQAFLHRICSSSVCLLDIVLAVE